MSDQRGHKFRGRGKTRGRGGRGSNSNQRPENPNSSTENNQQIQSNATRSNSSNTRKSKSFNPSHGFEMLPPQSMCQNTQFRANFVHPLAHLQHQFASHLQPDLGLPLLPTPNVRNAFRNDQPFSSGATQGRPRGPGPVPQNVKHINTPQQVHASQGNKVQQQVYASQGNKAQQQLHASQGNKVQQEAHVSQGSKIKQKNENPKPFQSQSSAFKPRHQSPHPNKEKLPCNQLQSNTEKHPEHFKFAFHTQSSFENHTNRMLSPQPSEKGPFFSSQYQTGPKRNIIQPSTSADDKHHAGQAPQSQKKKRTRNFKPNAKNYWQYNKKKQQQKDKSSQENLFTFSRVSKVSISTVKSSEESDDDSVSVVSTHSSVAHNESVVSSDESLESMQSSLFNKRDQVADLKDFEVIEKNDVGYATDFIFQNSYPKRESYISVFWDIENCPVPNNKSAIDIVKKIRDVFYEHRTEEEFIVACDTRNLDKMIDRELTEAHVTIIHANSQNKNAADFKLQGFLQKFQQHHRQSNSAIVLISGDSDFSTFLYDLRYQHLIYINLICNEHTRKALRLAAHQCVQYIDFITDLPDRMKEEELFYCLIVSNLPNFVKTNAIKANLAEKIKNINGKIKKVSATEVEIIFMNYSACEKAMRELEGYSMYDTPIVVRMETQNSNKTNAKQAKSKIKASPSITSNAFEISQSSKSEKIHEKTNVSKKSNNKETVSLEKPQPANDDSKQATMYIFVSQHHGDQQFWQKEFKNIFKEEDLVVQWLENNFERYFLVTFHSLSKAQKAKKALLKLQASGPFSPRFIKIVKGADCINLPISKKQDLKQIIEENIENHIQHIRSKEAKCLEEFKDKLKAFKELYDKKNNIPEEQAAFQDKRNELNEQKIVFTSFTEQICRKIKDLNGTVEEVEEKVSELMKEYSRECVCLRAGLPIYAKRNAILKKIKAHQVVVLQAQTGSGKSTQVCQYLWREDFAASGMIICTQPRKIAAISVANHVSSQIGCAVGGIVGYQVGLLKRMSDQTKILYVTDFTMLKICTENPLFNGISCIMIDEAHERSVYTDILLGMVKRALKSRPDLHVIITSATIQSSLFKDYFALADSAIYQVPGRSFPIKDVWLNKDVALGWDYLSETVNTAHDIVQQSTGDILAFLTTPLETEKASEQLKDLLQKGGCEFDVSVLQLHGKLDISEQRKVFEKTKPKARKVVFSTNCAETSITIPGIKYVIDCGMVKEAQYDAVRNLNILSVGFTNKSSAEQRRGRAGRTESGTCFRLYSESNYENNMAEDMVPEILRINLGKALLKLMILGIKDPIDFDFIKSPSADSMHTALNQLIYLGAINPNDKGLTDFGQKMSFLPLEPRLCYIILKAIEKGIGYDAVVIAALATVSRNIFFRNSENCKEADTKKIRFCQSESDFLTFLEIYKEWSEVPKTEKSRWCVRNCINARSMRLARELVNEIILTLSQELDCNIPSTFSKREDFTEMVHELIFFSFSENICIFSGHSKFGYRSLDIAESLYIHPSSSLYSLGSWRPQYIVYDAILKTSQTFLINITVVKESVVESAHNNHLLKLNIDFLKSLSLVPYVFWELGDVVLKTLLGKKASKLKALEQELKKSMKNDYCTTEVDFPNGKLSVFIPPPFYSEVQRIFLPHIEEAQFRLFSWEQELNEMKGLPQVRAIICAGLEIKEILLPGDFRVVKITPVDCDFASVLNDLQTCGKVNFVREGKRFHKVSFKKVISAKNAVKMFENNKAVIVQPLDIPIYNSSLPFFKILIHLSRRLCTGNAFFNVQPPTSFLEATQSLALKSLYYQGHPLQICHSKKVAGDFCLSNVPQVVNKQELQSVLNGYLPAGIHVNKLIVVLKPEFQSDASEVEQIGKKIIEMFTPFTLSKKLHIDLKPPKPKDKDWQAIVYFENPQDGQIAVNVLKSRKSYMSDTERSILKLHPLLETFLICHKNVFSAIKKQIDDAVQFFNRGANATDKLDILAKPKDDGTNVLIQISSNNIADINDARRALYNLIQGDQIHCSGKPHLEKLFTNKGQNFLRDLSSRQSQSFINIDKRNKILSLFGNDESLTFIKSNLNSFLDDVEKENFEEMQLKLRNSPKSVLKEVITQYDVSLSGLRTACGLSSAEINVYKHTLTISGNSDAIEQCKKLILDMQSALETEVNQNEVSAEECPVCYSERGELFHRLEYCGHVYCKICLFLQITTSDSFPLCCCKEGCNKPLVLEDMNWAIKAGYLKEKELHSKAFKHFMTQTKEFKYCPTPDCPMVYRVTVGEEYSEFNCPQCGNSICTRCCIFYHAGMSCGFYQSFKTDDDHSLKVWMNADRENHKLCPACKSPIEKNGGCMHMTCWKCQCHMCWRCMKTFPSGDDVYSHQAACPVMLRAMYGE